MAANNSNDAVKCMEEARDSVRPEDSPQEKNDCYFKVIDMQVNGQEVHDRGGCYSIDGLVHFYNRIPPQPVHSIRVILDGRPEPRLTFDGRHSVDGDSYPRCQDLFGSLHFDPSETCPLYSTEAIMNNSFHFYHLPTLRKLWAMEPKVGWYGIRSFAEHTNPYCPNAQKFKYVLRPTDEDCSMHLTACRNRDGLVSLICYAPNAHVDNEFGGCANTAWRLLKVLALSLHNDSFLRLTNGRETQALQLLIIRIHALNLENMMEFIERAHIQEVAWVFHRMETKRLERLISTSGIDFFSKHALLLQTTEEETGYLIRAIEYTSQILISEQDPSAPVHVYLDEICQKFDLYKELIRQHKDTTKMIRDTLANRLNVRQANSVNQLTLLAAFFLPLSLAAGVLSMQTRFSELGLILYDFMGVVFILGTTAAFFYLISRHGRSFLDTILYLNYSDRTQSSDSLREFLRIGLLSIWWLAALASFLVGMFKGAIFGLKIFGYEAAGITALWLLSLKLVRWAYDHRQKAKKTL